MDIISSLIDYLKFCSDVTFLNIPLPLTSPCVTILHTPTPLWNSDVICGCPQTEVPSTDVLKILPKIISTSFYGKTVPLTKVNWDPMRIFYLWPSLKLHYHFCYSPLPICSSFEKNCQFWQKRWRGRKGRICNKLHAQAMQHLSRHQSMFLLFSFHIRQDTAIFKWNHSLISTIEMRVFWLEIKFLIGATRLLKSLCWTERFRSF